MGTKSHSNLGIVSCLIGLFVFLIFLTALAFAYFEYGFDESIRYSEAMSSIRLLDYAFLMFVPIPLHLIGLVLGLISLFFPNRKKLFPILGTIGNLTFGLCGLIPYLVIAFWSLGRVQ